MILLLKDFIPESVRNLADGRQVTVKGYQRTGVRRAASDAKKAAARRPQDFTTDMFSGETRHEAATGDARASHEDMLWEAGERHRKHFGLPPAAMDQLLSNPRAHAHLIERTAVHRMDPEWQRRYSAAEKVAPRYDHELRKAADPGETYRRSHEPTDEQLRSGNYPKRRTTFQGLAIRIETEAGGMRRGVNKADGHAWERRMPYAYGYLQRTLGVDGDEVDCFIGLNSEAPVCFVVRARTWGAWSKYDEDKLMLGFDSEEEAKRAFLLSYSDPRFLRPIDAIPVCELRARLAASSGQMLKALPLFFGQPAPMRKP